MKPQDPRGYYEVLGVPADASAEAIKRAFRAVAMECHPDKNADSRAAARFRKLSEAYAVLSDDRSRATYDRRSDPGRRARARGADARAADAAGDAQAASAAAAPGELIHCSCCNRPTAQPRHAVYWTVISVLVTWRRSTRGVYCAGCANRISLRCTALTAALGWWGVLGLVWTPLAILRNARGGQRQEAADAQLLWRNAKAFLAQGKPAVAHALARQVAAMKSANALDAADLLAELHRAGVPRDTPPLVDPWRARAGAVALQGGLAMAAPVLVGALVWVYGVPAGALATPAYARALEPMVRASFSTIAPGAEPPGAATAAPPAPTCARPPQDGELLEGRLDPVKFGHHVEVNNGADGPTIIKLRDADTGRLRLAFFVSKGGHAKVGPLPDGAYRIQYAVGSALAQDCKSFTSLA
ncbi:MAG: J domain-containing protein, partial [Caulobacterales bacterium]